MERLGAWLRLVAAVVCLTLGAGAATAQAQNKDYQLLNPAQPTSSGNKIEVIEFFSYACPHCQSLQPSLAAWLKRKPADVDFKRIPAVFQEGWLPFARLYYTLEALNLVDKLHHPVFDAIHGQKIKLQEPNVLFDWVASKGVERKKFIDTYNSFSVQSLTQRAKETTGRYGIPFTPALVIDGRYLTGPSMTSTGSSISYDRFFQVVDQMIAGVRKKAGAK
ncbi:MAG TPA: thiol:disulfide interchange protein DsbA/DsbL [Burkholderiales bacterium]|nr:thiol:disulfide interchange protein DsbA/DsbL [Burkholderiales bacterium]